MKRIHLVGTALIALTCLAAVSSIDAAIIVDTGTSDSAYSVSSTDLANVGEPTLLSMVTSNFKTGQDVEMNDGINSDGDLEDSEIDPPGASLTYNFDLTVSPLGYDITGITTLFGGTNGNFGGRANQGYRITLTFVNDTTAVLADGTWEPNLTGSGSNMNGADAFTQVVFTEDGGGALDNSSFTLNGSSTASGGDADVVATGVKAITFDDFDPANVAVYLNPSFDQLQAEEFDVFGTPTPEPGTLVLIALGGAGALLRRRRRA